jgi:hypothetical protein
MATNLATILVGLGYDLSALEKGAPEAFRLVNEQTLGMSASMKRSSREGAESLRLIDEALGIHLSRPLTRILTQEFPALATGLQSILGAGVVGALAVAGFEFFDKIAKSIEKAQKAQEALKVATESVSSVFEQEMSAYATKDKAITAATAAVDRLAEAEQKQAQASRDAAGVLNGSLAAIGTFVQKVSSFQSTLNLQQISSNFSELISKYNVAALKDSIDGTAHASKMLADEIHRANDEATKFAKTASDHKWYEPGSGFDDTSKALNQYAEGLQRLQDVQNYTQQGVRNQEALKTQAEAAKALAEFYKDIADSMKKLDPVADPIKKLTIEIDTMKVKAQADFFEMGKTANTELSLAAAAKHLSDYESNLDRILAKAKADADVLAAQKDLPTKLSLPVTPPSLPPSSTGAQFDKAAGGTTGAQFSVFSADQTAQLKLAAKAYDDIITPAQKLQLTEKELDLLVKENLIDRVAYNAALAKAKEEAAKTTDQLNKLLEKTGDVNAGLQAFFLQLQTEAGQGGKFTFEFLNKGLQGFEDETVKAITGGKTAWRQYFEGLTDQALKFLLNKEIAAGVKSLGIGGLFGGQGGAGGAATLTSAGTTLTSAGTLLTSAATELQAAATELATSSASGGGGGVIGDLSDSGAGSIPGNAAGTDNWAGGLSWVGEDGPELMNVPSGSSITPNKALGGMSMNMGGIHIDAKGAEIGVEEKIARALSFAAPRLIMNAAVQVAEIRKRSLGR